MEAIKISLAAARVNAGLTQKELGVLCDVSESTIVNWESGRSFPSVKKLSDLEKALGMSINYIDFRR